MSADLGTCPTGRHTIDFGQCGYAGCVNLRPWAEAHRYRWRFEQSYHVETDPHVKGDGRWFVEVVCHNGLLYPYGSEIVLAYANRGVCSELAGMGLQQYQSDGKAKVFKLPVERLEEVAAILKPRQKRSYSPEELERKRERLRVARERKKALTEMRQMEPGMALSPLDTERDVQEPMSEALP